MALITDSSIKAFDTKAIHRGDLIRACYHTWTEPRNGVVAQVSPERIVVLYLPGLGNVSNYYPIAAKEVADGLWTIRWSTDLETTEKEGEDE
nr:DUF5026 domain-containing protein [uncultured Dysosmobacter sp.]